MISSILRKYNKPINVLFVLMCSVSCLASNHQGSETGYDKKDTLLLRNEVSMGIGKGSFVDFFALLGSSGDYTPGIEVHGHYLYNVHKNVGIGLLGISEFYKHRDGSGVFLSAIPVVRLYYYNSKHFAMYSKLGIGVLVGIENGEVDAIPMVNLSGFGMEFGDQRWRGFTELLPIGSVGILNFGVKHSF